jgi:PAS domain S-box-containing protein
MTTSVAAAVEPSPHTREAGAANPPRTIGVLAPFLGGFYFGGVLSGAARAAATMRHPVLAVQTFPAGLDRGEDPERPPHDAQVTASQEHAVRLATRSMSGIVVVSNAVPVVGLEHLHRLGKPMVLVSTDLADWPAPMAGPDNVGGVRAVVDHLVRHGHRRIGFVGHLAQRDMAERHHAYRQALLAHGIAPRPEWLLRATDTLEAGGRDAGRRLVNAGLPTTAVVAATDRNAMGLVEALRSYGVQVPEQQAVAGFDNTEAGARHTPPLTTVEARFDLVGELAARLLVTRLRGGRVRAALHRTATSLVVRQSCGCSPSAATAPVVRSPAARAPTRTPGTTPPAARAPAGDAVARGARAGLPAPVLAMLERAARRGERPDAAVLDRHVQACFAAASHPETVTEFVVALRSSEAALAAEAAATGAAAVDALRATVTELLLMVLRAHLGVQLRRQGELESSVARQVEIGMELFRPGHPDPRRLGWLATSHVTVACLGLWDDAGDRRRLQVTGVHDPSGALDRLIGARMAAGDFPPAPLRQRVTGPGEAVVILPLSTERRDWGLLAVIGSVEHRSTSVRDTYNHWATLLTVALEQDALIEDELRQRESLEQAFHRERELATSVRASEERYALVARATDDGLWDWDVSAGLVYYSPRWKSMLGYDDAEIGDGPGEWLDRVHPEDREDLAAAIAAQLGGSSSPLEMEHRIRTAQGDHRWVLCRALTVHDDAGYPVRMVGALVDLADRKALEEQLSRGALYDARTGLPNRALFLDRLELAIARCRREPGYDFAVFVARVRGEDGMVRAAARRLADALVDGDSGGRLGRADLGVLLDDVAGRDVTGAADRLAAALAAPSGAPSDVRPDDASPEGVTYGLAPHGRQYASVPEALRAADIALHRARAHRH